MNRWITEEIGKLHSDEEDEEIKDVIVPRIKRLIDLVEATTSHCSYIAMVKQYFMCLGINYYRVSSYGVEKIVSVRKISLIKQYFVCQGIYYYRVYSYGVEKMYMQAKCLITLMKQYFICQGISYCRVSSYGV